MSCRDGFYRFKNFLFGQERQKKKGGGEKVNEESKELIRKVGIGKDR